MRHEKIRAVMSVITDGMELVLGIMLTLAVVTCAIQLVPQLGALHTSVDHMEDFRGYLEAIFTLVIGVEALKMIYKHSPGSAIEVLLYAIARELIVTETTALENLIGIISIAILFAVRKYLFVPAFGAHMPDQGKGLSPDVAKMMGTEEKEEKELV